MSVGLIGGPPMLPGGPQANLLHLEFGSGTTNYGRDRIALSLGGGMTVSNATTYLDINSGGSTTSGDAAMFSTWTYFPLDPIYGIVGTFMAGHTNEAATNSQCEFGFALANLAGVANPFVEGIFFRLVLQNSLPTLLGVVASQGTESAVVLAQGANMPSSSDLHRYGVEIRRRQVFFSIDDLPVGSVVLSKGTALGANVAALQVVVRVLNTGTASIDRHLLLADIAVYQTGGNFNMPFSHQRALAGDGSYQAPPGFASSPTCTRSGGTAGTAGWPASGQAQVSGTYTPTSAPAKASLGGFYLTPAMNNGTITLDGDIPVFSYGVQAGSATVVGRNFLCTGVRVGEIVVVAGASTSVTILGLILGINSTVSATTTTEAATALAARGIVLGQAPFKATAVAGDFFPGFSVDFSQAPLLIPPGNFLEFIIRPRNAIASNTLAVTGSVAFMGYFV